MVLANVIKSGVIAILPIYKNGNVTKLITRDDRQIIYDRTCKTVLKNIAKFYGVDLAAVREQYRSPLNKRYSIPIPFSKDLILVPVKVREKPLGKNDGTLGYISLSHIEEVRGGEDINCQILLKDGLIIKTKVKKNTVKEQIKDAYFVQNLYLKKHFGNYQNSPYFRDFQTIKEEHKDYLDDDKFRAYLLKLLIKVLAELSSGSLPPRDTKKNKPQKLD